VAKKKATRKGARGARKATARRRPRKAVSRPRAETARRINLKPLQKIIAAQIKKLESYPPSPKVEEAMKLMVDTKTMVDNACISNPNPMVIDF
jgi:hypothetical protein